MVPPINDEKKLQVIQLFEEGKDRSEISKELHLSMPTVRKTLSDAGYSSQGHKSWVPVDDATRREIIDLRSKRYSFGEIAKRVGRAKRTVMNVVKDESRGIKGRGEWASPEEFIITWQECDRLDDVAAKLGLTISAVASRAWQYRTHGIPLKKYSSQRGYDWEELKQFADLFNPSDDKDL